MRNDSLPAFILGGVFGIILLGLSMRLVPSSDLNIAKKFVADTNMHISECEKELPRNQKCVIIAIPEKQNATTPVR